MHACTRCCQVYGVIPLGSTHMCHVCGARYRRFGVDEMDNGLVRLAPYTEFHYDIYHKDSAWAWVLTSNIEAMAETLASRGGL